MSSKEVLLDPTCAISSAVAAAKNLLGKEMLTWDPDTIQITLKAQLGNVPDDLMAKLLAGITILTNQAWTYDHEVLFAFALACCGIPADGEAVPHPTPEQLCWAVDELQFLFGKAITVDEGFDPQTVDPAVAVVLHDEGYVLAPDLLHFVQEELDALNCKDVDQLRRKVEKFWSAKKDCDGRELRAAADAIEDDAVKIQIGRLVNCELYVRERRLKRAQHHVVAGQFT